MEYGVAMINKDKKINDKDRVEIAKQIIHEGEIYLKETISASDAIDRKATIFLSVFISLPTALVGKLYDKIDGNYNLCPIFVLIIGLYFSCYYFIKALRPQGMYLVGNHPKNLIEELNSKNGYSYDKFLLQESMNYQSMIEFNSEKNSLKGSYIEYGLEIVMVSVFTSCLCFLLFQLAVISRLCWNF